MNQSRREFIKKAAALSAASCVGIQLPFVLSNAEAADQGASWHRGSCRLCGVGCRLELGVKNGQPIALRGVPEARTNFGYLCMKGMNFWKCMRHPDRLTKPLYRAKKTDKFQEISWEKAIDIAADKFAEAHKSGGGAAVAYYGSGQALTEETYLFQKIMRGGLQSNNVEGNPRLCMASAVGGYQTSFGADEPIGGYADIEKAHCFFIIGSNTAEAHPVLFRRIMRRKLDNPDTVKVINVDPRISQTSRIADKHLQFKPGTDLTLLNGMAHVICQEKLYDEEFISKYAAFHKGTEKVSLAEYRAQLAAYTPEEVARVCGGGFTPDDVRVVARWFAQSKGTVSLWTMGLNQRKQGVFANNLVHNLHILTGQLLKDGADSLSLTGQPNACGGVREAGGLCHILPGHRPIENDKMRGQVEAAWGLPAGRIPNGGGLHTMAMFQALNEGKIKALWINCTNPAQSLPNLSKYEAGFKREDNFIVCTDIFPTLTTQCANLVLPTAFHFEKTGVYGCTERRSQLTKKAIDAPGQAKPEVWIAREWAKKLAEKLADPLIAQCVKAFDGLEEGYALPKAIWDEYSQKITAGRDSDLRGATYAVLETMADGAQWPAPTEAHAKTGGTVKKFVKGRDPLADAATTNGDSPYQFYTPGHDDHKLWIWLRDQAQPEEIPDAEYPFYLSTGRIVDHWHTMTMTGRIPELLRANPYAYVEINPKDAGRMGIGPGDMIEVKSRRGRNLLPAKVIDGPLEGMVFVYWHDQHPDRLINKVTIDAVDAASKEPEFKICAAQIKRVSGPQALTPYLV
ncbi:MAG: molybdopterin-dependent oxidoreductase [Desulfobulbaceae bacterium]|jgi:nitrate reductase NapA|nr:molybdopterin-dependent oxidoreductase [Desulfobulbaceae bacterium]